MAVFILAVIVNSYNTGQVRAGPLAVEALSSLIQTLQMELVFHHFSPCICVFHVVKAVSAHFLPGVSVLGEDGEPPPLSCTLQLFFCFLFAFFSSPRSAFSQYYINMTNHKSHMCS